MKNRSLFILTFLLLTSVAVYPRYQDTGFITWTQPNGTTFIARSWGDEYFYWMETDDGYRITKAEDGWYYYAKLDNRGEFAPSNHKVGIDYPLPKSKGLERSNKRKQEIENFKKADLEELRKRYEAAKSEQIILAFGPTEKKVGVILVDFPTKRRDSTANGGIGYTKANFENMYFSNNYSTHPERPYEQVFGSVNEYYLDQTNGHYSIVGKNYSNLIVNPTSQQNPNLPEWLELNYEMSYYESLGVTTCFATLEAEAKAEFGTNEIDSYDALVFIYGGEVIDEQSSNFYPRSNGNRVMMGEKEFDVFAHIGTHCHELGHVLFGLHDEYEGSIRIYDLSPEK